jgi:4-aminobutyrate aminotransferase-like enzyme
MGLLWGIEIVRDKATREPVVKADKDFVSSGDTSKWPSNYILQKCLERDVYLSGIFPNTLRIIPPLTVARSELDHALDALDYALTDYDKVVA